MYKLVLKVKEGKFKRGSTVWQVLRKHIIENYTCANKYYRVTGKKKSFHESSCHTKLAKFLTAWKFYSSLRNNHFIFIGTQVAKDVTLFS